MNLTYGLNFIFTFIQVVDYYNLKYCSVSFDKVTLNIRLQ